RITTASTDHNARAWDTATGKALFVLPHQNEVLDVAFSADGALIATASRDRTAMIWDAATGLPHSRALPHQSAVRNVVFSPDGKGLLTVDQRGLRLWDVSTGHPLTVTMPQPVQGGLSFQSDGLRPAFLPNGRRVFMAAGCAQALIWELPAPPPGNAPGWF